MLQHGPADPPPNPKSNFVFWLGSSWADDSHGAASVETAAMQIARLYDMVVSVDMVATRSSELENDLAAQEPLSPREPLPNTLVEALVSKPGKHRGWGRGGLQVHFER